MVSFRIAASRDGSRRFFVAVLLATVCCFAAAMYYLQRSERAVEAKSVAIRELTTESVVRLARINASTLESQLALAEYLHTKAERRAEQARRFEATIEQLREDTRNYLTLEMLPGERSYWLEVQEASIRFEVAARHARKFGDFHDHGAAQDAYAQSVEPASRRVMAATMRCIEFDARLGRTIALELAQARAHTRWLATGLAGFCALLGIAVGWLSHRRAQMRRALVAERSALLEERAAELDQFAGRVAHDIRNPLAAAKLSAELAQRFAPDQRTRELTATILRALSRADAITNGLLQFARAGAHNPDPGARAHVRSVIDDVATGMAPDAARTGVTIHVDAIPPVLVACSSGVYMSMIGNLVRNAIKYMGDSATRQILLRVSDDGTTVRTEVVDTGPGIPEAKLPTLFQPYTRAHDGQQEGLGLGLATVKRLAEGHGGRVGVVSEPGKGSTFWFELPRAGLDPESSSSGDDATDDVGVIRH